LYKNSERGWWYNKNDKGVSEEDRKKKSKLDEDEFCGTKHWETNYNSVIKDPYS